MTPSRNTRRWLQVSLKSLFILTVVVAAYFAGLATTLEESTDEVAAIREENDELRAQTAELLLLMADANLPPKLMNSTVIGRVQATNTSAGLVEINLGTDDGLKVGDELDVYRVGATFAKTRYLGRIELMLTNKGASAGQILPKISHAVTIQKGDHVAAKVGS